MAVDTIFDNLSSKLGNMFLGGRSWQITAQKQMIFGGTSPISMLQRSAFYGIVTSLFRPANGVFSVFCEMAPNTLFSSLLLAPPLDTECTLKSAKLLFLTSGPKAANKTDMGIHIVYVLFCLDVQSCSVLVPAVVLRKRCYFCFDGQSFHFCALLLAALLIWGIT